MTPEQVLVYLVMVPALALSCFEQELHKKRYKARYYGKFDQWQYLNYKWCDPINKWYRRRIVAYSFIIWGSFVAEIIILCLR